MDFTRELQKPIGYDPDTGAFALLKDALKWDKVKIARFQERNAVLLKSATTLPVTPKRAALKDGQFSEVDPKEIEYEFGSPNAFFGTHANLVPLASAVQGTRVFYGARFANQALPLVHGEAPLVQNLADDDPQGRSFDEILGKFAGAIRAEDHGKVLHVTPDEMHVQYPGGVKKHGLYRDFPLNRKTSWTSTPLAKEGDTVIPGQVLAKSNFTDDKGVLNMGVNVRVGLVPDKGHSMDDAVVISEPLARRLMSNQLYGHDLDYKRGIKGGKSHYTGIFPNKFTNSQLEKLDKDGVAKSGATLNPGDPIILATRPRVISSGSAQLGKLSVHMRNARSDAAVLWDKETPGQIVDVEKLRNGVKVNVGTDTPAAVGDKLSFRSGGKMIISLIKPEEHMPRTTDGKPLEMLLNPLSLPCFDDQTEFLTDQGWLKGSAVTKGMKVATLNPQTLFMEFQVPEEIMHLPYTGDMYKLENQKLDMLVTPNHRQFSAPRCKPAIYGRLDLFKAGIPELFELKEAKDIFDQPRRYLKASRWKGYDPKFFDIPTGSKAVTSQPKKGFRVTSKQWAAFMGWYLAEGFTHFRMDKKKGQSYTIGICQAQSANPKKCDEISDLLTAMRIPFCRCPKVFIMSHKGLYELLQPFGKCADKYIPRCILDLPPGHLEIFLDALMKGDGHVANDASTGHYGTKSYTTRSVRLAGGLQEVAAKLGISTNVRREKRHGDRACYLLALQKWSAAAWTNWSNKTKINQKESWVPYSGTVHCVTVPNGVVFVRRNGKAVFSGNSRVNTAQLYELLLGKAALKQGQPYKLSAFTPKGVKWHEFVEQELKKAGVTDTEDVFDPVENKKLENPITVGQGFVQKLSHTSESKMSTRGQGAYDVNESPLKGRDEAAKSKRLSGLESNALLSSGAYNVLREGSTLRGQRNDDYWRQLRMGYEPQEPGAPFVFNKLKALLTGSGYASRAMPGGKERLGFYTDKDLDAHRPLEVRTGDIVDMNNLEPIPHGLFDPALTGGNKFGYIALPSRIPNPAAESVIMKLLGITQNKLRAVLAGEEELEN